MHQIIKPPDTCFMILLKAWLKWRHQSNSSIPQKKYMSMRDVVEIVPFMSLLEIMDDKTPIFRNMGEQLILLFKQDMRGIRTIDTRVTSDEQLDLHLLIVHTVLETPQGIYVDRIVPGPGGIDWTFRTLSLPMTNNKGDLRYLVQAGMMIPPKGTNPAVWKNILSFDTKEIRISAIRGLDIDFGCAEPDLSPFPGVELLSPAFL